MANIALRSEQSKAVTLTVTNVQLGWRSVFQTNFPLESFAEIRV